MRYCGRCGEPLTRLSSKSGKRVQTHSKAPPPFSVRVCPVEIVLPATGGRPAVSRSVRLARVLREREAAAGAG